MRQGVDGTAKGTIIKLHEGHKYGFCGLCEVCRRGLY